VSPFEDVLGDEVANCEAQFIDAFLVPAHWFPLSDYAARSFVLSRYPQLTVTVVRRIPRREHESVPGRTPGHRATTPLCSRFPYDGEDRREAKLIPT
jgi:hypothetical protein